MPYMDIRRSEAVSEKTEGLLRHDIRRFGRYRRIGSDRFDCQLRATGMEDHQDTGNQKSVDDHVWPDGTGIRAVVSLWSDARALAADRQQQHLFCVGHVHPGHEGIAGVGEASRGRYF